MNYSLFAKALILMLAAEGLSLLAFIFPLLQLPLLVAAGIIALALSWKNLEWGMYVLFGELFFGSRGHLLEYDFGFASVSLRLVIFAAVFGVWIVKSVILRYPEASRDSSPFANLLRPRLRTVTEATEDTSATTPHSAPSSWPRGQNGKLIWVYFLLLTVIAFGSVNGYLRGNGLSDIFNDANGYLYLLILPAVLSVIRTREQINKILQIFAAAVIIIAVKTFLLFIWFSLGVPGVTPAYHWIIDQDFGEITGEVGSASRIFMQSQFYALMGLFVFALTSSWTREGGEGVQKWLVISAALLSILMSLSRSFWLGALAGGFFALIIVLWRFQAYFKSFLVLGLKLGVILILEITLLYGVAALGSGRFAESVSSRTGNPAEEAAGGARLLLLPELSQAIKQNPIFGAGFGKLVTYKSYLPDRVTAANPDGEITNFAFEWGYLDMMLKLGAVGLIIYLLFIARIFRLGFENFRFSIFDFQTLGLLSGLAALVVLNVTTPYLNHPLGIGYLVLCSVIFSRPREGARMGEVNS